MYEYDVIIGYYECPFNEEHQIELTIDANNSDEISDIIDEISDIIDESYHGMVVVYVDGYCVYN